MSNTESAILFMFLASLLNITQGDYQMIERNDTAVQVLSRKKRFLIFPEGSSLQLVFCLTIPSIGMGSIFTIGWTAALAWELPHEPIHPYKKKKEQNEKRIGSNQNLNSIENSKIFSGSEGNENWENSGWKQASLEKKAQWKFAPINYQRSPSVSIKDYLMNPGGSFPRRNDGSYRRVFKGKHGYRPIDGGRSDRRTNKVAQEAAPLDLHPAYKEVHRKTRRDLFAKIEKFLDAQRQDGKACLLKAICEVSKASSNEVGTFMEEIIKAVFKIRPYKDEHVQDEFDYAATEDHNCAEKYPRCSSSVWQL